MPVLLSSHRRLEPSAEESPVFSLYGLTVASELDLPGFGPGQGEPDVTIRWGRVPAEMEGAVTQGACYQAGRGRFLLHLPSVARYGVFDGREVIVDRAEGATEDDVRTILLGTVLAAVLYQRGLVPFHASAVLTPHGAALFGGPSGAGKSTLAAALARRGYPVLTDDVAPISIGPEGTPVLFPGAPILWLWKDALSRLDIPAEALGRVRPRLEKRIWFTSNQPAQGSVPVAGYYRLDSHNKPTVEFTPVSGMERVKVLSQETYRAGVSKALALPLTLFGTVTALAQHARLVRVQRPQKGFLLEQLADQVLADLERVSPTASPALT